MNVAQPSRLLPYNKQEGRMILNKATASLGSYKGLTRKP